MPLVAPVEGGDAAVATVVDALPVIAAVALPVLLPQLAVTTRPKMESNFKANFMTSLHHPYHCSVSGEREKTLLRWNERAMSALQMIPSLSRSPLHRSPDHSLLGVSASRS